MKTTTELATELSVSVENIQQIRQEAFEECLRITSQTPNDSRGIVRLMELNEKGEL